MMYEKLSKIRIFDENVVEKWEIKSYNIRALAEIWEIAGTRRSV